MSAGMAQFSTAVNSGSRWWNWKTKPMVWLRKSASAAGAMRVTSRAVVERRAPAVG